MTRVTGQRYGLIAALAIAGLVPAVAMPADVEQQRALFLSVYAEVERGSWNAVEALAPAEKRLLSRYVLWPDLRAAFFRANLADAEHAEVEAFLGQHGTLRPVRDLRYRYALHLAEEGHLDRFRSLYESFYQGMAIAELDCHALRAEIAAGNTKHVTQRALDLWMTPRSQHDACDPVFKHLESTGALTRDAYVERFGLAVEAREFARARWLARSIDAAHVTTASRWLLARDNPGAFVAGADDLPGDETTLRQLAYAIERMTYADPVEAHTAWLALNDSRAFEPALRAATGRHIALWMARDNLPGAHDLLAALPAAAQDEEVLRWRARSSLRAGRFDDLLTDIALMPAPERDTEEWRYWQGIARVRTGDADGGKALLEALAGERSYYGFLAADELQTTYALRDKAIPAEEAVLEALARNAALVRARELFYVGLDSRGRSEWDAAVRPMPRDRRLQAARLASRWGWHSRAIATAAGAGEFDDLSIRYPLPYREAFLDHSTTANIGPAWAYGVARSESLFMRDVRSSAGAIGLMQLMPSTGKHVARQIQLPYSGIATLTDPQGNIRLGTSYLGQMAERFADNRVLATAAYNAGPHRVDDWLPAGDPVDTRVWIETIPFNETRRYVRRVLAAETIFHWRMTGEIRRLRESLPPVVAPAAQVAQN